MTRQPRAIRARETAKPIQMRTKSAVQKVPVPFSSLCKRINFQLAKEGRTLRITKGQARAKLGQFFVTDASGVVMTNVDLEAFARQIGVLAGWEALVMRRSL